MMPGVYYLGGAGSGPGPKGGGLTAQTGATKNKSNGQINLNPGSSAPTQPCILVE